MQDATFVSKGSKDRYTNMEIKKPYAVVQCNKFVRDVERADQHLSYYSVLKKTKILKKGGTVSAKLCALQRIFCVQNSKYVGGSKIFRTGAAICTAVVLAPSTGRW